MKVSAYKHGVISQSDSLEHFRAGMYKGGAFKFSFTINTNYPHEPPKVKCTQKVRTASYTVQIVKLILDIIRSTTQMLTLRATSVLIS